jgi:protein-tyrosine phosphatase
MTRILFVCTGNYYRSRVAEILFNHFASEQALRATAVSRGLRLNPDKNKGLLSQHAVAYLEKMQVSLVNGSAPVELTLHDLQRAHRIIILDEREHRSMMRASFPEWEHKVEYWQIEDDYVVDPSIVLPKLEQKVKELAQVLQTR